MGKTKQERAQELLREDRGETLKLALAYIAMWGPLPPGIPDDVVGNRLLAIKKALGTVQ